MAWKLIVGVAMCATFSWSMQLVLSLLEGAVCANPKGRGTSSATESSRDSRTSPAATPENVGTHRGTPTTASATLTSSTCLDLAARPAKPRWSYSQRRLSRESRPTRARTRSRRLESSRDRVSIGDGSRIAIARSLSHIRRRPRLFLVHLEWIDVDVVDLYRAADGSERQGRRSCPAGERFR